MSDNEPVAQIAKAIQAKTGGNVEGKIPEWWAEFIGMVLDELQCTGRLIPAGGMALTAEQVEDVEALVATANPYSAPADRLRALFPATEPAEEAPNLAAVAREPRRFDPADECQNDNHDPGCVCGAQHWMTTPTLAVPAEEETKAEEFCCHPKCRFTDWGGINRKHERGADCPIVPRPASSPVVPAPTETGPWQTVKSDGQQQNPMQSDVLQVESDSHYRRILAAAEEG